MKWLGTIGAVALVLCGCRDWDTAYENAIKDAGSDAGAADAGAVDAGTDAGFDAGFDAGIDSGIPDAGFCGGNWCVYSSGGSASSSAGSFEVTQGVWASSPNDAWVTLYGSRLLHWNGTFWSTVPLGSFSVVGQAVWGLGPTDVFVSGQNGDVFRGPPFNTTTQIPGSGFSTLLAINGLPDGGSIYASGDDWDIYGYDGTQLVPSDAGPPPPSPIPKMRGLAVVAPDDIWIAGSYGLVLHNDGTGWQRLDAGVSENFLRAWANGPNDVWMSGTGGRIVRWNGTSFTKSFCPSCGNIWGLWGKGPDDMWVADEVGGLYHWDGGSFSASISQPRGTPGFLAVGLFGAGDYDLFLSTTLPDAGYGVLHFRR